MFLVNFNLFHKNNIVPVPGRFFSSNIWLFRSDDTPMLPDIILFYKDVFLCVCRRQHLRYTTSDKYVDIDYRRSILNVLAVHRYTTIFVSRIIMSKDLINANMSRWRNDVWSFFYVFRFCLQKNQKEYFVSFLPLFSLFFFIYFCLWIMNKFRYVSLPYWNILSQQNKIEWWNESVVLNAFFSGASWKSTTPLNKSHQRV
jgi:hypothetical protein